MGFVIALFLPACSPPPDQVVLARVGKEKIRVADLQAAFAKEADLYSPELLRDPEGNFAVRRKVLNRLVEERLLLQVAGEKKISLTPDETGTLDRELHAGYGEGDLERLLEEKGILPEAWREGQRRKRILEKLVRQEVDAQIQIDRREVEAFYAKSRSRFMEPDRVRCRHIVTNKREKTKRILSLLEKGENFTALAKKYSEGPDREKGGDLGYFSREEYPTVFGQACFTLNTGQVSDVVPSSYGFHIFQTVDKRPGHLLSLAEARPRIEATLREQKRGAVLKKWLEGLHGSRKIALDEEALRKIPENLLTPTAGSPETGPAKGEE